MPSSRGSSPNPVTEPTSPTAPAWAGGSFIIPHHPGSPRYVALKSTRVVMTYGDSDQRSCLPSPLSSSLTPTTPSFPPLRTFPCCPFKSSFINLVIESFNSRYHSVPDPLQGPECARMSENFPALKKLKVYQGRRMNKQTVAILSDVCPNRGVQFSSVAQSCPTLCDPVNCSTPGLPVHHQLPEFTHTHVH